MMISCSGSARICCGGPRRLVLDEAGEFELPVRAVDRLHVLDAVVGVEARRLHHLRLREGRRQMIGPEQELLHHVVPARDALQRALHGVLVGDVAAGQHRQRAEADGAAQQLAAVDLGDELLVVVEHALIDAAAWAGRSKARAFGST